MRGAPSTATFVLRGLSGSRAVDVLGVNRALAAAGGVFSDEFIRYAANIYRIAH